MAGLLDRIVGAIRGEVKAMDLAIVPSWRDTAWLEPSFARLTNEGYSLNAAVNACIRAHQFAFPEPPMMVQDPEGQPVENHPVQLLLKKPNEQMGESELTIFIITYLLIGGQCYLHKVRGPNRQSILELWPYHAGQLSPVPGTGRWVDGYKYDIGDGRTRIVPPEDIIHLKWPQPDPDQPYLAMPPLRAVAREVDTDNEATRYMYALLKNDATPRGVITVPAGTPISPTQADKLRQQFYQRHGGDNRGGVAILEQGSTYTRTGLNLQELAFDALRRVPEVRIAAAFGVPAIIAGLNAGLEKATYANFAEARAMFTENTLVPLWRIVANEIGADLGKEYGGGIQVVHDTSRVAALQENTDAVYTRALNAYKEKVVTKNEARAMLGLPKVGQLLVEDEGDTFAAAPAPTMPGMNVLDVTPQPEPPAQLPPPEDEADPFKGRRGIKAKQRQTETLEQRIAKEVTRYLEKQYNAAVAAVRSAG